MYQKFTRPISVRDSLLLLYRKGRLPRWCSRRSMRLHFRKELHGHAVLPFFQFFHTDHLCQVFAILRVAGMMMGNRDVEAHALPVCRNRADKINAFAGYVFCDVQFLESVFGIGHTDFQWLADSNAPATALVGDIHERLDQANHVSVIKLPLCAESDNDPRDEYPVWRRFILFRRRCKAGTRECVRGRWSKAGSGEPVCWSLARNDRSSCVRWPGLRPRASTCRRRPSLRWRISLRFGLHSTIPWSGQYRSSPAR